MKLLLTGPLQSGKSTRLRSLMASVSWDAPAGFRTWWEGDRRHGGKLMLAPWSGAWTYMAGERGRIDSSAFAVAALRALSDIPPDAPLVIDELGFLEAADAPLRRRILDLWTSVPAGIIIVQQRALDAWQDLGPVGIWP